MRIVLLDPTEKKSREVQKITGYIYSASTHTRGKIKELIDWETKIYILPFQLSRSAVEPKYNTRSRGCSESSCPRVRRVDVDDERWLSLRGNRAPSEKIADYKNSSVCFARASLVTAGAGAAVIALSVFYSNKNNNSIAHPVRSRNQNTVIPGS